MTKREKLIFEVLGIPNMDEDKLIKMAAEAGLSVSEFIRVAAVMALHQIDKQPQA